MDAIRQFIDVKDQKFEVILPDDFRAKRVEVIILPSNENYSEPSETTQQLLEERLAYLKQNPKTRIDFDQLLDDLENEI
ncbi:hypothetical protein [Flavobacterium sp.]|uniref:hypothetical protein n=1 Tax=Flavobacterium sp. TaxID=239 RepID=UPI003D148796